MTTVLVTGARGNTGRFVAPLLARQGATVRGGSSGAGDRGGGAVAAAGGVTAVRFDWRVPATWATALDGVDALYLARPELEDAPALVGALLDAAGPGVRTVLLSDNIHGDDVPVGSWEGRVEAEVTRRAVDWTLLRPSWFHQVLSDPRYFREQIRAQGELAIPTAGAAISFVDARHRGGRGRGAAGPRRRIRRAGADADGAGREHAGEVAARLSAVSGHVVRHVDAPLREAVAAFAADDDVDPWYAGYIEHVWAIMQTGSAARVSDDVASALGRPARSLAAFIDEHAALWRR